VLGSEPVRPTRLVGRRKAMWWFRGDAKVNGQIVAEADVDAMLTD
jgi:3-hydroxyacyl-[acyl-carrier-protein] dehydratase